MTMLLSRSHNLFGYFSNMSSVFEKFVTNLPCKIFLTNYFSYLALDKQDSNPATT